VAAFAPDVIVAEYRHEQFTALAALQALRVVRPTAPLIVVANAPEEQAAVACLRAGAEDLVLQGHWSRIGPVIDAALALRRPLNTLSPRQLRVLQLMAEGYSTREIARLLQLSVKTAEAHRGAVIKRLGIPDLAGLVRYAVRVGLVAPGGAPPPTVGPPPGAA
jgi:DNA-binding NarL/FixJ family response regulator